MKTRTKFVLDIKTEYKLNLPKRNKIKTKTNSFNETNITLMQDFLFYIHVVHGQQNILVTKASLSMRSHKTTFLGFEKGRGYGR